MQNELDNLAIAQILGGDTRVYAELVERYQHMAFTICKRYLSDEEEAREATQDAFVKCYQNLQSFRHNSQFSTWLYKIVVNTALSRRRKRKLNTSSWEDISDSQLPENEIQDSLGALENADRQKHIANAMAKLPPEEATLLTLYYADEQPVVEIAAILGLSEANVKVKLHRTRARMLKLLEKALNREIDTLL